MSSNEYPTYYLPDSGDPNTKKDMPKPTVNSVVIIGANGSGKSKLGAWIEKQDRVTVHRIGAQRSTSWPNNLPQRNLEESLNIIFYGDASVNADSLKNSHYGGKDGKTTTERRDVETVLSAVFAKLYLQLQELHEGVPIGTEIKRERNIIDDVIDVWDKVFPQRRVSFKDMKISATLNGTVYNGNQMSDGERVALYLISQALLVPENRIIVIDEPEIHLHRSIMNKLWAAIEQKRNDCLFIYITHDTQFAAAHSQSDKIWVKSFDGVNWQWEKVEDLDFLEQLLLELLGNRKPVIFVEGKSRSLDFQLFSILYDEYHIIPCESCKDVRAYTKSVNALKETQPLFDINAFGIVDRDFRCEAEICNLTEDKVYVLNVAEVENLFLVREIISIVNEHLKKENKTDEIINKIIDEYGANRSLQIEAAVGAEIQYKLSHCNFKTKQKYEEVISGIDYEGIASEKKDAFPENIEYANLLKIFNAKGLKKIPIQGLGYNDYTGLILGLARQEKKAEIKDALRPYLPGDLDL